MALQEEDQKRITREIIAEAIPARAGQLYRNNCTPGLSPGQGQEEGYSG